MTWALKRQIFYVGVLLTFFAVFSFLIVFPSLKKEPTCMDGKQNGVETGVDCGGSCQNACTTEVEPVSVLWSRVFKVVPGRYNAVAYLLNQNKNTAVKKINYKFRFADQDNIYLGKREGSTFIPPAGRFAIFEPAVDVGHSIPVYTTFEWSEEPEWLQVSEEKIRQLQIVVSDIQLADETTSPRLSATVKNNSFFIISEVSFVVVLYDAIGNVLSASRTYLDKLDGQEVAEINFTWPEPILGVVVAKEIIPMYDIFLVKLK